VIDVPSDPEFEPFRAACRRHELVVQECTSCGRLQWPPRPICGYCYSMRTSWTPVSGQGALFSWTVVHRAHSLEYRQEVPYVIALAGLAEDPGVRLLARGDGLTEPGLRPGLAVAVSFHERGTGIVLPYWAPAGHASPGQAGP
jgi:uncharacterized OB-fold protein